MASICLHCAGPSPNGEAFCCSGCESVYALLHEEGLDRYYALRDRSVPPAAVSARPRSFAWLVDEARRAEATSQPVCTLRLDVQGIHCAACVWLIEELARRQPGGLRAEVNPTVGRLALRWHKGQANVEHFVEELARLGYLVGRAQKAEPRALRGLLLRLGVSVALTMNVMLLAIAFYAGLGEGSADATVATVFGWVMFGLASAVIAIGGSYFGGRAIEALRRRLWHLDIPIALGIVLAYGSALLDPRGRGYLDTLCVFVTLMLLGRYLQERVLERNRGRLLAEDNDLLRVRRIVVDRGDQGERVEWIPAERVRQGDVLLLAPGELCPVDGNAQQPGAVSTDWIDGEPAPRQVALAEPVRAGSFVAGANAMRVLATADYAHGALSRLLAPELSPQTTGGFWHLFARIYVAAVLGASALGGLLWLFLDPLRAPEVTVALLVVTCPCAIGIVTPLARELTGWRLRRAGLYLRREDLLDRLLATKQVLFDKTGTLTLGELVLAEPAALAELTSVERDVLYTMVQQSNHPVARALAAALQRYSPRLNGATALEVPSQGIECRVDGSIYRLGREAFCDAPRSTSPPTEADASTLLSRDGVVLARFSLEERIRPEAEAQIRQLQQAGLRVWLISGDRRDRVLAAASRLGIDADHVRAEMSAEDKRAFVESIDRQDTLFIGDGGNDCPAMARAHASIAVNVERPLLASRADGFVLGEGAPPIKSALDLAQKLRRQVRTNLVIAVVYNGLAVAACLLGWMTPLRAAIAMPVSSLGILLFTLARLRHRNSTEQLLHSPALGEFAWRL